jgi:hypothetical protein
VNSVRNLRLLNGMAVDEAGKWSVPESERRSYYRFDEGKPNLKRPGGFSTWLKMESVLLDSGEEVGVPESWKPPRMVDDPTADSIRAEANAALEPLTDTDLAVLLRIEDRIMKRLPVVSGSGQTTARPSCLARASEAVSKRGHAPRTWRRASTALLPTASSTSRMDAAAGTPRTLTEKIPAADLRDAATVRSIGGK